MAKGRKLTASRSERYLGDFGYSQGQGTANGGGEAELGEDDVWSAVHDGGDGHSRYGDRSSPAAGSYRSRHQPPRAAHSHVGGLSLAFDDSVSSNTSSQSILHQFRPQDSVAESSRGGHMATSAPVNVPDWSKIYRVHSVESLHDPDDDFNDSEVVPPHEYLARNYARSRKVAANSVFEGVGRTLKGRDLSRVRDAVWSQTGFDG